MSKWTDIRDGALDAVKHGAIDVVEETKQQFLANFIEAGVPIIEEYAAQFTAKVKDQSADETGWTKIRDAIVIPFAVQIGLYIGKQILQTVQAQTATSNDGQAA